uniref:ATP-dependent DNA helicase n=1 Tax=Salix viminalis TaxID=40686 RepID=A0A6N2NAH5_SALVM
MGSLLPSNENAPKFAQLYIYDVSNEVSNRMSQFPHSTSDSCLDQTIVSDLIKMLASTNCLVGLFRHASQKLSEPNNPGYKLQLLCQRTNDSREYSNPTSDDIGGLIVGDIGAYRSERDIIIESFSNTLQRISKLHPKFMALQYPLLFPFGEDGYRTNISFTDNHSNISGKRQRVPMRGFYAYVIQEREYGEDTLIKGGRLYQQFLVDAFANIEEDRLDYIRMNQNDLRSDLYQNISEAVLKEIAYGNPDLFITFTCNTKWPEIERELDKSRGYKPEDKPDIITRVFRTKLLDMLKFIKSGAPFGETIADVHSIEFQKRGLPHTHILVWLASKFKFRTSADIDSIVSAEIPDKNIDPLCHDIVCKFMLHGPCGVAKPGAQCMSGNAVWRILQFPIHSRYPPVERLQIHLPFQQNIVFSGSKSLQSVLRRPGIRNTMLTEWFECNKQFPDARELYYSEFPKKYVWDSRQKQWTMRSKGSALDLACKAHGLLGDDKEWSEAFCEAIATASSPQLRQLFVGIILFCQLKNYVLYELEQLFNASATTLQDHSLPMPDGQLLKEITNKLLREELDYDLSELRGQHSLNFASLNHKQRVIYDSIIAAIFAQKQALVFVHGHGGTGKTFLWHTIINRVRSESLIVLAVASSGIASLLLPNGRTAHSRFKIPLSIDESSTCAIKKNTHLSNLLQKTALIVWDEAPIRNQLNKDLPFGGKTIYFGGDFRQILPVIPVAARANNASLTAQFMAKFTVMTLKKNAFITDGLSLEEKAEIREFLNGF